ncbi:MAG: SDR family NAD(P)-dependent oxidoreductase [bacterium]|nr:SDR family NAD(P)-dependent oxidoreductase [bacterium]
MPENRLTGKVAVVTGGGRGIGRAIALAFADEGADLCLVARTESQLNEVAEEVRTKGRQALTVSTDVTDRVQVEEMAAQVNNTFGQLDILVNNAGGGIERNRIAESDPDLWIKDVRVNLISAYLVTHALLPLMIESGGGKIINTGSGMGHRSSPKSSAYHVGKAGLWMFTQCLAEEVWEHGIDVNELVPGPVASRDPSRVGATSGFAPSERVKATEDVAPLALFLATQPPGGPTAQSFSLARRPI